jgi:Squalene-hopene cyclase C-terminal domain
MEADPENSFLAPETSFRQNVCLPFLLNAQNADGGWGFHPKSESRAEPTCWALQALRESSTASTKAVARGVQFLRTAQLSDGSWPSTPEERTGCWVTALCCWVLQGTPDSAAALMAGLGWVCNDWPQDSTPWRRFLTKFSTRSQAQPINNSYRGWGWTPGTSSWVEPTSFGLLALEAAGDVVPPEAKRRRELGEAMLYDRMCPSGGWNCGNPRVYGVPGVPLIIPTVWALIALRHYGTRPENIMSLDWLDSQIGNIQSAGSLALAKICMETCGGRWPTDAPVLAHLYERNGFLESIQVAAWTCLASSARSRWLAMTAEKTA